MDKNTGKNRDEVIKDLLFNSIMSQLTYFESATIIESHVSQHVENEFNRMSEKDKDNLISQIEEAQKRQKAEDSGIILP